MKTIFLGTGEFGEIVLKGLIENGYKNRVSLRSTEPCNALNYKPVLIYDFKKVKELKPDLVIIASYGKIIPKKILQIPKYGCLNVHPSLLPKYRGPSPIQTTILNGDKKTGVTIMLMDEEIDHGPILGQRELEFSISNFQFSKLHDKLAKLGVKLLIETIPKWIKGKIKAKPQDHSKATYTKILKREDGKIDWSKPGREIERQIRAFNPWPGTFTFIKHKNKTLRIKVLEADISKDNKLIIKKLQPEGKKPMTFEEFQRGYHGFNPI